ncbi:MULTISPECIES: hypothetical protein [Burkholderia]|uniref:hypothetical protein n=1 Tax=unclassified Burkholderia TaxID=2613784 RepID=UPI0012E333CD|nr:MULTISPECIES: hypothetical protein [Burkholderia]
MQMNTGNRDERRYYPEGLLICFAGHVAQMDFMRIDFYDDIVPQSPNGGTGTSSRGIFAGK